MLELRKAGLYIANGKNTSVLIKVAGEAPLLEIISGVLLNDMEKDGTITPLGKDSIIIQDIVMNPKNYIFELPSVSEAVTKQPFEDSEVDESDVDLEEMVDKYLDLRNMYPEKYIIKMQVYIIGKGYSKTQADRIINKVKSRIRMRKL